MSFAETYLRRYASEQVGCLPIPDNNLNIIIVIPVYNEPGLLYTVNSLLENQAPGIRWEIILVINEPEDCPPAHHKQNIRSLEEINGLAKIIIRDDVVIHTLHPDPFPKKKAGPGYARKIGMDEAARRFSILSRPEGIIVSCDADTIYEAQFIQKLFQSFSEKKDMDVCTLYFEHNLNSEDLGSPSQRNAIIQYELYMRYFRFALEFISFPYNCYTLGSAFAVRASMYVKAGGMGVQQAGEDFYFLQKCLPLGKFWELNELTVYPSPRLSDRVIFGTGPFIDKFIRDGETDLKVYQFKLFLELQAIFHWINSLKTLPDSTENISAVLSLIDPSVKARIENSGWVKKIEMAIRASAGISSFKKKVYHEINLLEIIKLLNDLSDSVFPKKSVNNQISLLFEAKGISSPDNDVEGLLSGCRSIDKARGNIRIT